MKGRCMLAHLRQPSFGATAQKWASATKKGQIRKSYISPGHKMDHGSIVNRELSVGPLICLSMNASIEPQRSLPPLGFLY